jgi:hypothetical protein
MNGIGSTMLSVAMLAAFFLLLFGARLMLTAEHRKRGGLMLLVGVILIANVLILTI